MYWTYTSDLFCFPATKKWYSGPKKRRLLQLHFAEVWRAQMGMQQIASLVVTTSITLSSFYGVFECVIISRGIMSRKRATMNCGMIRRKGQLLETKAEKLQLLWHLFRLYIVHSRLNQRSMAFQVSTVPSEYIKISTLDVFCILTASRVV